MNSTVLALLMLTGLNALPERPPASPPEVQATRAVSPFQPSDQASRLAVKGREPKEGLQLRLARHIAVATAAP